MSMRVTVFAAFALFFFIATATPSSAAVQARIQKPIGLDQDKRDDEPEKSFGALEEEMRAKRAIRTADKEHQDNLDRARELLNLADSIVSSLKQKNELDREDIKKLEKMEKLAKGIRSAAGGSEDDVEMDKPPRELRTAVDLLADLSKSLKENVEKTPKHVVSAAVIDEANVLLQVIRIVRTLPARA